MYENYISEEDALEEFNWHVKGLADHIVEGVEGTDKLINFDNWESIIDAAAHEAKSILKNRS